MKIINLMRIAILSSLAASLSSFANPMITHYGNFTMMLTKKETAGVVNIQNALNNPHSYAIGAIANGIGEITAYNGKVFLSYGKNGFVKSQTKVPSAEKAVILASADVKQWQYISLNNALNKKQTFKFILAQAKKHGINTNKPFPFALRGKFDQLHLHIIDGRNPKFTAPGHRESIYKKVKSNFTNKAATLIGFYSANTKGVYTHIGSSWHLHALINNKTIGAHTDNFKTGKHMTLLLPKS